MSRMINWL